MIRVRILIHATIVLALVVIGTTLVATGYVPSSGFSHHPQHELIFGIVMGALVGMIVGLALELLHD